MFEDKSDSALSKLLACAYNDTLKSEFEKVIIFSDGDRNIRSKLAEYLEGNIIVYVDVVPDNVHTIEAYKEVEDYVLSSNITDRVIVMPIPCIEYYVIKAFCKFEYDEVKSVIDKQNYRDILYSHRGRRLRVKSFEKYCKSVLNNYLSCFDSGYVYEADCYCPKVRDNQILEECICGNQLNKAWMVITELPAFVNNDRNIYFKTKSVNLREVKMRLIQEYNKLAENFVEAGYIRNARLL